MAFLSLSGGRIGGRVLIQRLASIGNFVLKSTAVQKEQADDVRQVKPFQDIPGPKGIYNWPVIGTMLQFKPFTNTEPETVHRLFDQLCDTYGPVFKINFGGEVVFISAPEDIETVFRNEGKYPVRPNSSISQVYAKRNNIKPTVVDLDGPAWHKLRSALNKRLMKVGSAHVYLQPQNLVADEFVQILASNKLDPKDLAETFFCYSAESIGIVCFNTRLGFLDEDAMNNPEQAAFLAASKDIFVHLHKSISGKSLMHDYYRNKVYRDYEKTRLVLRANTLKHLHKAKDLLESKRREGTLDLDEPNLLLSLLSDDTIDFDEVVGIIKSLYVAGTDSTAKNLQTFLYNLATNPDKQEKLRDEVHRVIGRDQPVTSEALAQMHYLKACLKESFRLLYPTVSGTRRVLPINVVLGGYLVPAGTHVAMHNPKSCKDYFPNSDKFIPERWLRTSSDRQHQEAIPMAASLPFGSGPKNCIGRRFAEQEMYLVVAKTMQNLKVEVEPESYNTNFVYALFIKPEKPIRFKFTKLTN